MSEAATLRKQGFKELLERDSEILEFRQCILCGIVDRGMDATALDRGQVDLGERNQTRVEVLCEDLDTPPRPGEQFTDEDDQFHRIKVVRRTDNTYRCDCELEGDPE